MNRKQEQQAGTVQKNFPVLGMSCASCAASAQSILEHQPGVTSVSVNYANASAYIRYDATLTGPSTLKAALQEIGYDLDISDAGQSTDALEVREQQALRRLKQRMLLSALLCIPLIGLGMSGMDLPYANYIMWALATPILLVPGRTFFIQAYKQARHLKANMDTLVALSTGIAYLFSVFNTLFAGFWHRRGLHGHVYFEAAGVVITFILLGKWLEERAKGNTSTAIRRLMGLQPDKVTILRQDKDPEVVPMSEVVRGDLLLARPGDRIAVDGSVTEGRSFIDESMISGEPVPVEKQAGSGVYAGTINQKGSLVYRAEKVGAETRLAHIIRLVQEAQGSRAPVQKLVDKIAGIFVPVVMGIALLTLMVWWLAGGVNGFSQGLMAMVTVLVIACPCALGLATPTAIMVGIGKAAENGILIRNAESIELAGKIDVLLLDKTGTITLGKPLVTDMVWYDDAPALPGILKAMEQQSAHPLAAAIVQHLHGTTTSFKISASTAVAGSGGEATVNDRRYYAGSESFIRAQQIRFDEQVSRDIQRIGGEGKSIVLFAGEDSVKAVTGIADALKPTSVQAIQALEKSGIDIHLLTGDHEAAAQRIAMQTGIRHYQSQVSPEGKAAYVKALQQQGKVVAMAGDGINDSAALALADVSIAMGHGSDVAMQVASITLISSDLLKIPQAIHISSKTVRTIRQNLFWAFIYNIIGIPVAAGVLYPVNGFLLNPMIAGAAMVLSSISVVSNSLRLKWASTA